MRVSDRIPGPLAVMRSVMTGERPSLVDILWKAPWREECMRFGPPMEDENGAWSLVGTIHSPDDFVEAHGSLIFNRSLDAWRPMTDLDEWRLLKLSSLVTSVGLAMMRISLIATGPLFIIVNVLHAGISGDDGVSHGLWRQKVLYMDLQIVRYSAILPAVCFHILHNFCQLLTRRPLAMATYSGNLE